MKDLKLLLIGDSHLQSENPLASTLVIEETLRIASDVKPDIIVALGDTLHFHAKADITPLKWATDWFCKLQKIAQTYILIGNHDMKNPDQFLTTDHIFYANKFIESGPTIVDTVINVKNKGYNLIMMPYVPPGRMMEALGTIGIDEDNICKKSINAILCHQDVAALIRGIDWDGDEWSETYPQVYSGHIHHYIKVQPNWTYVGSSRQVSCAEDPPKTISLITFNDDKQKEERLQLNIPIKQRIETNVSSFKKGKHPLPEYNKMVSYFLYVTGDAAEIEALKKLKAYKNWRASRPDVKVNFPIRKDGNSTSILHSGIETSGKSYAEVLLEKVQGTDMEPDLKRILLSVR